MRCVRKIVILLIALMVIGVGFLSGCTNTGDNFENGSSDVVEEVFFNLSGNITNNYDENIEIDYAIITDDIDEWQYWAPTIEFTSLKSKHFSCEVKTGYPTYWFWVQLFYLDGTVGFFLNDFNFSNPTGEDMTYYIEVKTDGVIEIFTDYSAVSKIKPLNVIINPDVTKGDAPLTVTFLYTCDNCNDNISEIHWDFGDGETSKEMNPTHVFKDVGTYTVSLTITDDKDASGTETIQIEANFPEPKIIDYTFDDSITSGGEYVFGVIGNPSPTNIYDVILSVTFYDASNNIIKKVQGNIWDSTNYIKVVPSIIEAGETAVFFCDPIVSIDYFDHYDVEVTGYETTTSQTNFGYDGLIFQEKGINIYDDWQGTRGNFDGTLKNTGSKVVDWLRVAYTIYDLNGKIIYCWLKTWDKYELPIYSGEETSIYENINRGWFDVHSISSQEDISNYQIILEYYTQ